MVWEDPVTLHALFWVLALKASNSRARPSSKNFKGSALRSNSVPGSVSKLSCSWRSQGSVPDPTCTDLRGETCLLLEEHQGEHMETHGKTKKQTSRTPYI